MASQLIIVDAEELQESIADRLKGIGSSSGIYVSLNKTQQSTVDDLSKMGVDTETLFFIDCVTTQQTNHEVVHLRPESLDLLSAAIFEFIRGLPNEKVLIIDGLSTLLIFNSENRVMRFIKEVTEYASAKGTTIMAFSPRTKGEDMLAKIFNFFDAVQQK